MRGSMVELHCVDLPRYARLSVSDSGAGITRPHLERIFDRFYRVDPARYNSARGTGLGLAITHNIVKRHGGFIRVKSEVGVGTAFEVFLPALAAAQTPQAEAAVAA